MNKYELAVVVNANIEDEERNAVVDKCKALIERFGGQITNVDDWGKKRLAYEIKDSAEGYYVLLNVTAEPACVAEVDRVMKINDDLLKHMIVRVEE